MSCHTSEYLSTQSYQTFIECPYLITIVEYLAKIISFFLLIETTTHSKKFDPHQCPHASKCAMG
jgi:hypothetical protein